MLWLVISAVLLNTSVHLKKREHVQSTEPTQHPGITKKGGQNICQPSVDEQQATAKQNQTGSPVSWDEDHVRAPLPGWAHHSDTSILLQAVERVRRRPSGEWKQVNQSRPRADGDWGGVLC